MAPNWHQTYEGILVPGTKWEAVGMRRALNISYWEGREVTGALDYFLQAFQHGVFNVFAYILETNKDFYSKLYKHIWPPCKTPEAGTGGCTRTARGF